MGRALDMEHRVKKVVGNSKDELKSEMEKSKDELKANVDALRSDIESRVEKTVANSKDELKSEMDAMREETVSLRAEVTAMHGTQEKLLADVGTMLTMMKALTEEKEGREETTAAAAD
jgi:chromosome segregation ATPase